MNQAAALAYLADCLRPAWSPPFRGQIWEYARKLNLQAGYSVKGPLDLSTLPHLIAPLEAIRDPAVRLVSIRGAVQTTKSLIADICVPYWIEHDPGDILWLLEDEPKAREYADRCMGLIKSIPEIAAMLQGVDRHDNTKTGILFKHLKLLICGLNAGNVQSLSWRYVIVDECWLHPFDGLIRQAMDRTKQYPDTKKILLLSQGGWEDDDQDRIHRETDQRELHYRCPFCGHAQSFELSRERPEEFRRVHNPELQYAGLAWHTNPITRPNGRWDYEAAARTAHHVCIRCAGRIEDNPGMRRRLAETYHYPAGNPAATAIGFHWPAEASIRLPLGDQVKKYLSAKTSSDEQAYRLPLQEFYQKDRGLPWSERIGTEYKAVVYEPYDVKSPWKDEAFRPLIIDCQKDLQKFFFHAYAVSLAGEARMLDRGQLDSFDAIAAKQKEWGIKDQLVFLDCGYEMTKVLRECVRHGHVASIKVGGKLRKIWRSWTGMKGSGQELFCHINPATQVKEFRIYSERKFYDTSVGTAQRLPRSPWYEWSNLHCKDLLRARRDAEPNAPKFLILPDARPPTDIWSYWAQMRSEYRREDYNGGRKRSIWVPIKQTNPNHDWDIGAMLMAFMAIVGIIGQPESTSEAEGEDQK